MTGLWRGVQTLRHSHFASRSEDRRGGKLNFTARRYKYDEQVAAWMRLGGMSRKQQDNGIFSRNTLRASI